jgi:hypothetical protein
MNQSQQYEDQSPGEIQEINHKGDTQFFSWGSRACRHATSPLCRPPLHGLVANWKSKAKLPKSTARTYRKWGNSITQAIY